MTDSAKYTTKIRGVANLIKAVAMRMHIKSVLGMTLGRVNSHIRVRANTQERDDVHTSRIESHDPRPEL